MKRTFYKNQIAEQVIAATVPLQASLAVVEEKVVITEQPVNDRIAAFVNYALDTVTGIPNYLSVAPTRLSMRNDILKQAVVELVNLCAAQQGQINDLKTESNAQNIFINAISNSLSAIKKQTADSFLVYASQLALVRTYAEATQAQLLQNQSADVLIAARTTVLESQQIADALADVALQKHDDSQDTQLTLLAARTALVEATALQAQATDKLQDAQLALLTARAGTDEAAIAVAQAGADAADKKATTALSNAAAAQSRADMAQAAATTAQGTANQAITAAAAAQSKANADEQLVIVAQTKADSAYQIANSNIAAITQLQSDLLAKLPSSAIRRFSVATPAVTLVVATPATFAVTIPTAFADNNYFVFFTKASGTTLLNVQLADTNKTASTFTVTMQTTGAVNVAVAASSPEVLIIHA